MTYSQPTVYLVDDDPQVLQMLDALVASIAVDVRAYASAQDFLAAYSATPCECLICDLRMPDIDGMQLQKRLEDMQATLPIIFLTGYAEVNVAVEAMKHGAFDFLEKPFRAQALLGKVQAALDLSRAQHARWLQREAVEERMALLAPRERNVLRYVVEGRSTREVAELLRLTVRTVENDRGRIMDKLHVTSTVDLVKLFL